MCKETWIKIVGFIPKEGYKNTFLINNLQSVPCDVKNPRFSKIPFGLVYSQDVNPSNINTLCLITIGSLTFGELTIK